MFIYETTGNDLPSVCFKIDIKQSRLSPFTCLCSASVLDAMFAIEWFSFFEEVGKFLATTYQRPLDACWLSASCDTCEDICYYAFDLFICSRILSTEHGLCSLPFSIDSLPCWSTSPCSAFPSPYPLILSIPISLHIIMVSNLSWVIHRFTISLVTFGPGADLRSLLSIKLQRDMTGRKMWSDGLCAPAIQTFANQWWSLLRFSFIIITLYYFTTAITNFLSIIGMSNQVEHWYLRLVWSLTPR